MQRQKKWFNSVRVFNSVQSILTGTLLTIGLWISTAALAQQNPQTDPDRVASRYQIELIVFQHLDRGKVGSDHWVSELPIQRPEQLANIEPVKTSILSREWALLSRQPHHYKILLHQAWIQPVTPENHWVYLSAASDATSTQQENMHAGALLAEQSSERNGGEPKTLTMPMGHLVGTFEISLRRYFSVHIALAVRKDDGWIVLRHARRLLSDELNYFDGPSLGVLLKVKEVEG